MLKEWCENVRFGHGYECLEAKHQGRREPSLLLAYLGAAYDEVRYGVIGRLICRYRGHDMVSEDWGGPESGGMAGYCKRCGFSYHHTLY